MFLLFSPCIGAGALRSVDVAQTGRSATRALRIPQRQRRILFGASQKDVLAVGEVHVFQMGEVRHVRVLAVGHARLHVDDHRIFQFDGEVVFLGAGRRGAIPLQAALVQALAGRQGVEDQRRRLVEHLGDHQRFVHALPGRLAGLRVARDDDLMLEGLHQDLVLMAFLKDVANRVLGEGAGSDQALFGAF